MPTNETIIAVPITIEERGQLRQFLVRLVEKLDIVLGYRGDDPYVSISQLQTKASSDELTQLEQTVLNIVTQLFATNDEAVAILLAGIVNETSSTIDSLKSASTISDNDTSTQTISNPPTQAEVQSIQDQVVANAGDFNSLLTALRGTEIIAT
jgi:hypothetical protein